MKIKKLKSKRVLVIEDEIFICLLLQEMLKKMGCLVVGLANRSEKAVKMISETEFDVAIVDLNLNGESSYPAADMLIARQIPFVFSTGYGPQGLAPAYRHIRLIQKPFGERDLAEALLDVLKSRRAP
jgi:CheY-like chemotaxis protein